MTGHAVRPPFDFEAATSEAGPAEEPRALRPVEAELVAATGAILLFVALTSLKWFGTGAVVERFASRVDSTGAESGWRALADLRWLVLVTVLVALVPLVLRLGARWMGPPRRVYALVAVLGSATALLLAYRVLIDLPDPSRVVDQKAGAILGLLGAVAIAVGGLEAVRAQPAGRARGSAGPPRRDDRRARPDRRLEREIDRINS